MTSVIHNPAVVQVSPMSRKENPGQKQRALKKVFSGCFLTKKIDTRKFRDEMRN